MVFELSYRKLKDTKELYSSLENSKLELQETQNYVPIYKRFFNLNEGNYNSIALNSKWLVKRIDDEPDKKLFNCTVVDASNVESNKEAFVKCSPLLDPLKFMLGKYDTDGKELLPKTLEYSDFSKIKDVNNSAYTDSFFSYLTSKLLEEHGFIHGLDFYGSFLGIQKNFTYDARDDIEYLYESSNFHKNKGVLFEMDESYIEEFCSSDTSTNRPKLRIDSLSESIKIDEIVSDEYDELFESSPQPTSSDGETDLSDNIVFNMDIESDNKSSRSSSFSSRTSETRSNESDEYSDDSDVDESEMNSDDDERSISSYTSSNMSDDTLNVKIFNLPVEVICLEGCYETLDKLIDTTELSNNHWKSILIQVIMTLLAYEKAFDFTHNDLHTNNIMYIPTEKQHLYYLYNGTYYKVPTYGKIFKIIDFGRAIYKFKGKTMCSDSYAPNGDAATQYNMEPYLNEKKPRLEPHYGFDLCRLGCALYDELVEEDDDDDYEKKKPKKFNPLSELIKEWCEDDKGKNICYKKNGIERYPDFKLYKMIARSVHNPTPAEELKNPFFNDFITTKKMINKKAKIMNIDKLPSYV